MESKYCSYSLGNLRSDLRKRNAKLSGRKKELIERLEVYDRNFNFGANPSSPVQEYMMKLPNALDYKDLNSDKKFADVEMNDIAYYLGLYDKKLDQTPINLYKEKYLCYLRWYPSPEDKCYFLKSGCRAEMRKSVVYIVDVSISDDGQILEAQCECGAGMGPNAHCKHVATVIYACHIFSKKGTVLVENTCTEKLQSFHKVKKYTGSPVKSNDLNMPGADESTNISFDPRKPEHIKSSSYSSNFRNLCINFAGISNSCMPINQLFESANIRAMAHDHDYLLKSPEDTFLEEFGLVTLSSEQILKVEEQTRGQNTNKTWSAERQKRLQSSNFGRICKLTDNGDPKKIVSDIISPRDFTTKYTEYGKKHEKMAIKAYEKESDKTVAECGIFVSKSLPFLGCSPDGVVSDELIIEVKCPYTARNEKITMNTVPYFSNVNNNLCLNSNHNYYYQIQGQLYCSNRQYCDFIVFTLYDIKCFHIKRDDNFISTMLCKLQEFYTQHFEPVILKKYFYKE